MTRDQLIARLVAIADERPDVSIGHVVEHELPELRAQAEAMPAQPVAWMYQHEETGNVNFRPINERWVDHRRYVEIPLYVAPPSAAQPAAEASWKGEGNPLVGPRQAYENGYSNALNDALTNGLEWVRSMFVGDPIPPAAPPDLAARVAELEALLREVEHEYTTQGWLWPTHSVIRAALAKGES